MLEDANKAYFKSQGWPMMLNGEPKSIVQLDKGELTALTLKYAVVLQTEYAQIKVPPKPDAPVKLMQSHTPAALSGIYFEEAAEIKPGALAKLIKRPGVTWTPGGKLRKRTKYATRKTEPAHAKRGHGPRGKRKQRRCVSS